MQDINGNRCQRDLHNDQRNADGHDRETEHGGENRGGEQIQYCFDIQNRRIAGHPFMHCPEDPGAAGAKQHQNGDEFFRKFVMRQPLYRRENMVDQTACGTGGFANLFFQEEGFPDDRTQYHGQYDSGHKLHFDNQIDAQANRAQTEGQRQRGFDAIRNTGANNGAKQAADNDRSTINIRSN